MLEMYGVSKRYPNGVLALSDVNVRVGKGEFVFLVGPSGAGKSTFVRLIYAEEGPTAGRVLVSGRDITRLRPREIPYLRRTLGVVFQDFKLLPQKTAFENVALTLQVVGASRRELRRKVNRALALVGLSGRADHYPAELSGGEQQRVSLARALVNNPVMLIADEPTGNLDPDTSWQLISLLEEVNRQGTTVIVATHAWDIVDRMRKRVIEIEAGKIVRDEEGGRYRNGP